jgi:hypothetical protein
MKLIIKLLRKVFKIKEKPLKCHVCGGINEVHKPFCYKNYYQ